MAQPRANITAPPARPPRYGLIAAAEVVDDPELRWPAGFSFAPEQCTGGGRLSLPCNGSTAVTDAGDNPAAVEGDPFMVYAGDECSTFGFSARDYQGRARRLLEAIQSYELANEVWTGSLGDADSLANRRLTDPASDTLTDGPTAEVAALACVEQALGVSGKGRRGMVHMTPQLLLHLVAQQAVLREGNLWLTPMGHIVVADAGYDGSGPGAAPGTPAGDSQWLYGTSMMSLRLGPIEVLPGDYADAMDRLTNRLTFMAQRAVAYVWDECVHVAAEVDVPTCLPGGAS